MNVTISFGDLSYKRDKESELRVGNRFVGNLCVFKLSLGVVETLKTAVTVVDPSKKEEEDDKGNDRRHKDP